MNRGGQIRNIKNAYIHPSYVKEEVDYDIAILELDQPLKFVIEVEFQDLMFVFQLFFNNTAS